MLDDVKQEIQDWTRLGEEQGHILYEAMVTRDPALLHQYKLLRQGLYDVDERFVGFRIFNSIGAEDYDEPTRNMIVLKNGNRCYGGACFVISTPQHPVIMDLENDILPDPGKYYFSLRERLPELELDKYGYAECSRVALHPALRSREATRRLLKVVQDVTTARRIRYLFCIGDKVRARFYTQVCATLGQPLHIVDSIDIPMRPEYEGRKMYLLMGDTKHRHVTPEDPEAKCLLDPISDSEVAFY